MAPLIGFKCDGELNVRHSFFPFFAKYYGKLIRREYHIA